MNLDNSVVFSKYGVISFVTTYSTSLSTFTEFYFQIVWDEIYCLVEKWVKITKKCSAKNQNVGVGSNLHMETIKITQKCSAKKRNVGVVDLEEVGFVGVWFGCCSFVKQKDVRKWE